MSSNEIKKSREELQQKNNLIVNRMMAMLVLATMVVVGLLMIHNNGQIERAIFSKFIIGFQIASGVIFAGALAFFILQRRKNADESGKYLSSTVLLILGTLLFAIFMLYRTFGNTAMVVLVIAVLGLSFVYNFYQKDYFYYSIFTVFAIVCMYFIRTGITSILWRNILFFISTALIFLIPIGIVAVLMLVKSNNGILKISGKSKMIMKPSYLYIPFFVGAGIAVLAGILGLILGSYMIYGIIAQLAAYLLFGIIYTIKMI